MIHGNIYLKILTIPLYVIYQLVFVLFFVINTKNIINGYYHRISA